MQVFLGTTDTDDTSRMIFEAAGDFESSVDFSFIASFNSEPTTAPQFDGDAFLTLELRTDLYPEELGLQLRASNSETAISRQSNREDTVIFFRPPRHYLDFVDHLVTEKIPIPTSHPGTNRQYILIVTDSYGDGMCCNWVGNLETGYTLYEGEPDDDNTIVTSRFEASAREITSFTIEGAADDGPTLSPANDAAQTPTEPQPTVDVKVTITLDIFPDETGYHIEDQSGRRVVDVPPGTYREQNEVVEEILTLDIGFYTFTIVDVFGDGLNRDDSFYRLDLVGEDARPALLTGTGVFVSQESQAFILEGVAAQYPLTIKFSTDEKPREFGFFVKRLDVLTADALVASVPRGAYQIQRQDVSETFMIKEGGLYRIVFEDAGQDGIGGDIRIIMGSENPNDFNAISYLVDGTALHQWQVKIFAGILPVPRADANTLDLRIQFDKFPFEMEWILLGNADQDNPADFSRVLREQEVIGFGPLELYGQNLENSEYVETIRLPEHAGEKSFTIIITDAAGDGGE